MIIKLRNKNMYGLAWMVPLLHTRASIFAPLAILGGGGYLSDRFLNTKPVIMIIGVGISFIISEIILFKKVKSLTNKVE